MTLSGINSVGINAWCSELIIDEESETYFLSVAGYQSAVKGIIANFLQFGSITVNVDGKYFYPVRSSLTYTVHYRKLPSGLYQCVTLPKIALPDDNKDSKDIFLVIAQTGSMARDLFFKHLDNSTDIPLHPLWSHWLWEIFSNKCWLTPLKTLVGDYQGYLIQINEDELSDTITMAIVEKNPAVICCFEKGVIDATDAQFEGVS
jgi:hypothetical protein